MIRSCFVHRASASIGSMIRSPAGAGWNWFMTVTIVFYVELSQEKDALRPIVGHAFAFRANNQPIITW